LNKSTYCPLLGTFISRPDFQGVKTWPRRGRWRQICGSSADPTFRGSKHMQGAPVGAQRRVHQQTRLSGGQNRTLRIGRSAPRLVHQQTRLSGGQNPGP
jgi:hypothetical protein